MVKKERGIKFFQYLRILKRQYSTYYFSIPKKIVKQNHLSKKEGMLFELTIKEVK